MKKDNAAAFTGLYQSGWRLFHKAHDGVSFLTHARGLNLVNLYKSAQFQVDEASLLERVGDQTNYDWIFSQPELVRQLATNYAESGAFVAQVKKIIKIKIKIKCKNYIRI